MDFAFLHGGGQGSWVWDETIAALRDQAGPDLRCLALDAPGCGAKRNRDTSAIAFADIARELVEDIVAAGLSDVVLVGHSQAGMTMPDMAALAPSLFRRLIFVTCSAPLPGVTTLEQMGNTVQGSHPDQVGWPVDPGSTSLEERYRAMFCNDMGKAEADAFLAGLGADMWPACCYSHRDWAYDHLAAMPVSYVACLRDASLPMPWQERFAERLHADRLVTIDAGHQAMNTRAGELAALLLAEAALAGS